MAKKVTAKNLRALTEELFGLRAAVERYEELEALLKDGMRQLKFTEVVTDRGRIFISTSERTIVPVEVAMRELGQELANKVIVVKKSVSNEIVKAFVKAGEINEAQREALLAGAERTPVVNLHVRPLK